MELIRRIWKIIKTLPSKLLSKQFLIFLFFLALSSVFWLLMTLNDTFEKEVPVEVRLVGVPKNAVITTEMADTVTVRISDKGFMLAAYVSTRRLKPINVNFQTYANQQTGRGVVPISDIQKLLYQQLASTSHITQIKPDRLEFYFNYGRSKQVPVRLTSRITPAAGYSIVSQQVLPQKVTVYANKKTLDSLTYVSTEALSLTDLKDTTRITVPIAKLRGVKAVPAKVSVTIVPNILTEASLEVPITAVNMPEGKILRTFPSRVKVSFTVCTSLLRGVKPEQFKVVADYKDLEANPSDKCPIYLRMSPQTVSRAHLEVDKVDYLVEQQ